MTAWRRQLAEEADRRRRLGLWRSLPTPDRNAGLVDLASNDYLGLSRSPLVLDAAAAALKEFGAGARASRLVTGQYPVIAELEQRLAYFKGTQAALVFPSGYQANVAIMATLLRPGDAVFLDRLSHSCLVDGVRLSGARLRVFPHNDMERLARLLAAAANAPSRWIIVEGVYSMDGDVAPLPQLLELAVEHDATVILDDAHGTGVLGPTGRGTAEHFNIRPAEHEERLIITATLSKALGSQGGVICGTMDLVEGLVNSARPFVYSTGLAPASAGAALAAIRQIEADPSLPSRLVSLANQCRDILQAQGLETGDSRSPIIPIILGTPERSLEAAALCRAAGILAVAIRPPTVPTGSSRLRLSLNLGPEAGAILDAVAQVGTICRSLLSNAGHRN